MLQGNFLSKKMFKCDSIKQQIRYHELGIVIASNSYRALSKSWYLIDCLTPNMFLWFYSTKIKLYGFQNGFRLIISQKISAHELSHIIYYNFCIFQDGCYGHLGFCPVAKLSEIFERYREKGRDKSCQNMLDKGWSCRLHFKQINLTFFPIRL